MLVMMNTKYLKKITRKSYRRSKSVLEPKNRGKTCKTPCPRANQQGTDQQRFHLIGRPPQHPRTHNYSVTSTLSTSRMLAPDSILPLVYSFLKLCTISSVLSHLSPLSFLFSALPLLFKGKVLVPFFSFWVKTKVKEKFLFKT